MLIKLFVFQKWLKQGNVNHVLVAFWCFGFKYRRKQAMVAIPFSFFVVVVVGGC